MKKYTYEEALDESIKYFGNDLSARAFIDKYALRNEKNELLELTPKDMHKRIAKELARIEKNKFGKPLSEEQIFNYLDKFKCIIPQGSPMYGIGNEYQYVSTSNCFVVESPFDSYGGICLTDQEIAQISKRRGGVGVDISTLRPTDSPTHNSSRSSTGTASWMERYSNTIREVGQCGRRGALMETISIHHPDILIFSTIKNDSTKVTGANISVRLSNEFLEALEKDEEYEIRWPVDSDIPEYSKMISAKEVWNKIIHSAWLRAEPGLLFWDNIINESPADCYEGFNTVSTNPCIPASEYLLTKDGYVKFGDCYNSGKEQTIVIDNRISYRDSKQLKDKELPENWIIDNKVSGTKLSQASHVFLTKGLADIIKITTSKGFSIKCTPDHHIATTDGMIEAKDIQPNHNILISIPDHNNTSIINKKPETTEEQLAVLIGLICGDGTFDKKRKRVHLDFWGEDKDEMTILVCGLIDQLFDSLGERYNNRNRKLSKYFVSKIKQSDKNRISSAWLAYILEEYGYSREVKHDVPKFIMENSSTNIGKFFLAGLFYCDGSVQGSNVSGYTVRLSQSNKQLLEKIQLILHSNGMLFGIYNRRNAQKRLLPDSNKDLKYYSCKENYELISICGSVVKYRDTIGFLSTYKDIQINTINHNFQVKESFTDVAVKTEILEQQPVFCIKEPISRSMIVNGMSVRRCGEIPLCAYDSCRLLAINLFHAMKNPFEKNAEFDFDLLYETSYIAQRLMDDIIDLEIEAISRIIKKIQKDPEPNTIKNTELDLWLKVRTKAQEGRRTGTGITALGDVIAALNIDYGSNESVEFTEKIYKTLKLGAYRASVDMAKELGPFPIWQNVLEKDNPFLLRIKEEAPELYSDMLKYGRRNISILTTAPTGTVSMMASISVNNKTLHGTTSGIEPVFMVEPYTRRKKGNPGDLNFQTDFVDQNGDHWMEFNVYHPGVELWLEITNNEDLKNCPYIPAGKINWTNRVKLQAAAQRHVDHSISSTINLPNEITEKEVSNIYVESWKNNLKGITVYRDGCRTGVLVKKETGIIKTDAPKRPESLKCNVHHINVKGQEYFVLVGLYENQPYEVFSGKNGIIDKKVKNGKIIKQKRSRYKAIFDDNTELSPIGVFTTDEEDTLTRLISASLRHGADISFIVHQLEKAKGDMQSFAKSLVRALKKYIPDNMEVKGEECPECGSVLHRQEGCIICKNCGFSKC